MQIRVSTLNDIPAIIAIAHQTWPNTYSSIISTEQINFMLDKFYNVSSIEAQMQDLDNYFLMASEGNDIVGYAHIFMQENGVYKLSKLYVLPNQQGKQIGQQLLDTIEKYLISINQFKLVLNVNRYNKAKDFYIKNGYQIIETVDIPLDKFWLNDYVMEKIFL